MKQPTPPLIDDTGASDAGLSLETVLDAAGMGVWVRDLRTNKATRSPLLERLWGFAAGEAGEDAQPFFDRIHPDDRAHLMQAVAEAIDSTRNMDGTEFRVIHPGGAVRWILSRGRVLRDADGEPVRLVALMADITERKRVESALKAALAEKEALLRQKDLLLREVHHRVRNNLQVISSLINLDPSFSGGSETPRRIDAMALIHDRMHRQDPSEALDFAEYLEQLAQRLPRELDLAEGAAVRVEAARVEVDLDRATPLALIASDALAEAVRRVGAGGAIRVGLRAEGAGALLAVEDDGPAAEARTGLQLAELLAQQIDATVARTRTRGRTRFALTFVGRRKK